MWYKVDFTKLATHLLPPILRSKILLSLLCTMIAPLRYLYGVFCDLKRATDDRLTITGNVQYLEKALNNAFYLTNHQIYIVTPEERDRRSFIHFKSEGQYPEKIYMKEEAMPCYFIKQGENSVPVNFIVMVPTFLCTSTDPSEDKYGGRYYKIITNILSVYKPAGRTFSIELYDYE